MRVLTTALLCGVLALSTNVGFAAIPAALNYQAFLTQDDGSVVDGNVVVNFSIYATDIGGAPLWSDAQVVAVDHGLISVELGNPGNPFPPGLFNTPLFIGVDVDDDGEMLPRRRLTSVGFAFEAENALSLQGQGPAAYDQSGHVGDLGNPHGVDSAQTGAATPADIANLQSQLDAALASITALQDDLSTTQSDLASANITIASLQTDLATETNARLAADATHDIDITDIQANTVLALDGILTHPDSDTAKLNGVNLQLVNGTGLTPTTNGLGNLIIGYNLLQDSPSNTCSIGEFLNQTECEENFGVWANNHKSGSHNLVIGDRHNYSRFSGIVSGTTNTISGDLTAITGGFGNNATAVAASVTGGDNNKATARSSSVSGGSNNLAGGVGSSVAGGQGNAASGFSSTISGGGGSMLQPSDGNVASGDFSSVSGGARNFAQADGSSISGGSDNTISSLADHSSILGGENGLIVVGASNASIAGGLDNQAVGNHTHVSGGRANKAWGNFSVVAGGNTNTAGDDGLATDVASNRYTVVVGGQFNSTQAQYSVVLGGSSNTMTATHGSHGGGSNKTYGPGPFPLLDCQSNFCGEGYISTPD